MDKFILQKDFDSLNFTDFRKALLTIEVRLAEFDANLESSVSDCFYETKKVKEQLEDLKPQSRKFEEVLDATKEIKFVAVGVFDLVLLSLLVGIIRIDLTPALLARVPDREQVLCSLFGLIIRGRGLLLGHG